MHLLRVRRGAVLHELDSMVILMLGGIGVGSLKRNPGVCAKMKKILSMGGTRGVAHTSVVCGGRFVIHNKCNEILRFVPLAALLPCRPAWLGLPASGWLAGWLAWVPLILPACWVAREAWLACVPVALVAWVQKTRSILRQYHKINMSPGLPGWLAWPGWLAVLAWLGCVAWL